MSEGKVRPIAVEDVTDYHPVQGTIRAKRINFLHADGTPSYIVVPHDHYNAAYIAEQLAIEAAQHAEVMAVRVDPTTPGITMNDPWNSGGS